METAREKPPVVTSFQQFFSCDLDGGRGTRVVFSPRLMKGVSENLGASDPETSSLNTRLRISRAASEACHQKTKIRVELTTSWGMFCGNGELYPEKGAQVSKNFYMTSQKVNNRDLFSDIMLFKETHRRLFSDIVLLRNANRETC